MISYYYKATCSIPQTYKQAINSPEVYHWIKAMQEEVDSLKVNNVFQLTNLPEGKNAISGRWVYKIKENPDGSQKYRARFVAGGYNQIKGESYIENFSPTVDITSVCILMQMVAQYDLIVYQMDVKTVYLLASID